MAFESADDIVRAWTDPKYRSKLTPEQLKNLPPNPAGSGELSETELRQIAGGLWNEVCYTPTTCRIQTYVCSGKG